MNQTASGAKKLKLVVMLGSLRRQSLHGALTRALPSLAPEGVTIELLPTINDFPIYCTDLHQTAFPEVVLKMAEAIANADGVILVTPEYNYSVPGGLKNAIDWLSRLPKQPFAKKPISLMSGSPGALGGSRCQYHLRQIFVFLDGLILNKPEVMISHMDKKIDVDKGEITDKGTRDFIAEHLTKFVEPIRAMALKS